MSAFTVRLPDDVARKLDALAEKMDRSRSYVAAHAIADFVEREAWQLADIEAGLREGASLAAVDPDAYAAPASWSCSALPTSSHTASMPMTSKS